MSWWHDAACREHPTVPSDAWFDLIKGYPGQDGMQALLVCRNECPVKDQCKADFMTARPKSLIAGGGWFDSDGTYKDPKNIQEMIKWRQRGLRRKKAEEKV